MVESEWTPELTEFANGAEAVTNYMRRTWSLFKVAEKRRPDRLVKRAERGRATFSRETAGEP